MWSDETKIRILTYMVQFQIFYGASIWAEDLLKMQLGGTYQWYIDV